MILKSFEEKKINLINQKIHLLYGENQGQINDFIKNVFKKKFKDEVFIYDELEVIKNENLVYEKLQTKSFFDEKKLIIINRSTDKIKNLIEDIILRNFDDINIVLTSNILEKKSPTSMGVATRQLDISRSLNLKDCLSMEFRICQAMMDRHDFYEGVRANLVDKDRDPKWKPITVDLLEEKLIDDHFKNLEDKELF